MRLSLKLAVVGLCASAASASHVPFSLPPAPLAFSPTSISQQLDLSSSLTKSLTTYSLETTSPGVEGTQWLVGVQLEREGFVEAWETKKGQGRIPVDVKREGKLNGLTYYTLTLSAPALTPQITLALVQSHLAIPLPSTLPQTADSVQLLFSHSLLSSIDSLTATEKANVQEIKVRFKTPTPRVLKIDDAAVKEDWDMTYTKGSTTITFTSTKPIESIMGPQIASVHYQNPDPVSTVRTLERTVEVSHWGSNLAVQDSMDLFNSGPLLEGQFSRLEYQKAKMQRRGLSLSINSLRVELPPRVTNPYYYDIVGNVSTSRFRPSAPPRSKSSASLKPDGPSLLELIPRYPVMGGWNYSFTMGYDAPLGDYLKTKRHGGYLLRVPFLTPIPNVAVDNVSIQIRLPEAARNLKVHLPFPVDSLSYPEAGPSLLFKTPGYYKTYLDSTGRPTVEITKLWCSDKCGADLLIEYTANPLLDMSQKPVAIAFVLSAAFAVVIALRRVDWSIGGGKALKRE